MTSRFTSLALAALLVLVLGPAAQAKSPPKGLYNCTDSDGSWVKIKSKTKYIYGVEDPFAGKHEGQYTTERKRIDFWYGILGPYYGKWRKIENGSGDHQYRIRIYRDRDDVKFWTCYSSWT